MCCVDTTLHSIFSFVCFVSPKRGPQSSFCVPPRTWANTALWTSDRIGKMRFIIYTINYFRHGRTTALCVYARVRCARPDVGAPVHKHALFFIPNITVVLFSIFFSLRLVFLAIIDVLSAVRFVFIYLFTFFPVIFGRLFGARRCVSCRRTQQNESRCLVEPCGKLTFLHAHASWTEHGTWIMLIYNEKWSKNTTDYFQRKITFAHRIHNNNTVCWFFGKTEKRFQPRDGMPSVHQPPGK